MASSAMGHTTQPSANLDQLHWFNRLCTPVSIYMVQTSAVICCMLFASFPAQLQASCQLSFTPKHSLQIKFGDITRIETIIETIIGCRQPKLSSSLKHLT